MAVTNLKCPSCGATVTKTTERCSYCGCNVQISGGEKVASKGGEFQSLGKSIVDNIVVPIKNSAESIFQSCFGTKKH